MLARLGRATGRAVVRVRDVDPAHRRDGLGVAFLVLAVVTGAGIWWGAGGPVGRGLSTAAAAVVGLGAVLLPVALAAVGIVLMATRPRPEARPRVAVGSLLLLLGGLGLVHLAGGAPLEPGRWAEGGGAIGYVAATPLASGLTAWVAVPVLVLLTGYALLVVTATPVRAVPARLRRLLGRAEPTPPPAPEPVAETEPVALPRPSRRRRSRVGAAADEQPEPAEQTSAEEPATPAAAVPATPPAEPGPDAAVGEQLRLSVRPARPAISPTSCRPATCCPPARSPGPAAGPTTS